MNELEVFEKVKSITAEKLGVDEKKVAREVPFKDLGADSLDTIELVMALEEAFGLVISDDESEKIKTVGDAVKHILGRKDV